MEMVSLLLEARASVTEEIADVAHADFQLVNLLLDAGGPATGRCLYYASSQGRLELVRWLLEAGADESYLHFEETRFKFHSTSPRRSLPVGTPLFVASGQGHLEVVQLLLKAGADQNEATLAGTPLYVACSAGHTQIVQLLLEAGADEDVGTETETPLYIASLKGHAEATRCLLNSRADVNRGNGRETPLYAAASRGHVDTVRLLLQAGADRYKGRVADMPLHVAKLNGHTEVVHLLQGTLQAAISFPQLFRDGALLLVCAVLLLVVRRPSAWKLMRTVLRPCQSWIGRIWTRVLHVFLKTASAARALEKTLRFRACPLAANSDPCFETVPPSELHAFCFWVLSQRDAARQPHIKIPKNDIQLLRAQRKLPSTKPRQIGAHGRVCVGQVSKP